MSDMYERKPQNLTGPGGNQKELRVKYIDNGDGTWSLATSATSLPLPTGASTAAKQDTTNIKLDSVISALGGGTTVKKTLIDKTTTTDVVYIGQADSGTATSASSWLITKVDKSSGVEITHTGATAVWDNRVSGSYS